MHSSEKEMKGIIPTPAPGRDLEESLEAARGYRALLSRSSFYDKGVGNHVPSAHWDQGNYQTPRAPALDELDYMMR